jgi:putative tricarboxylic transport membrane protein
METLELLMSGFKVAMQPMYLLICAFGGILGIIVGAMPGLGSVVGVALLLPLTYNMNPTAAIIMLAALYYGNMFGGAISSILINIPGDAPAVMAALDGYPMAKKGRGGQALFITFVVSFVGGFIGAIILAMSGSTLAKIGLKFGPPEIAMVIFVAMTSIGWLLGDSPVKGLISTGLGLLLACIGMDTIAGQPK